MAYFLLTDDKEQSNHVMQIVAQVHLQWNHWIWK